MTNLDAVRDAVTRTRTAQGLPANVEDEAVLGRVADVLLAAPPSEESAA